MKRKGFTLVEVITVLAIMSLLSLMIVPSINSYIRKKGIVQVETQCKIIKNAVNLYNSENIKNMITKEDNIINILEKLMFVSVILIKKHLK